MNSSFALSAYFIRLGSMLLLGCWILLGNNQVYAADPPNSGRVVITRGLVTATDSKQLKRRLRRGNKVYQSEVIRTGPKSRTRIVMADRSMLAIEPNSELVLEAMYFSKDEKQAGKDRVITNLVKGTMRSMSGLVAKEKPDAVEYKTYVAVFGVRGTSVLLRILPEGHVLATYEFGDGYVTNEGGQVELNQGQGARVVSSLSLAEVIDDPDIDPVVQAVYAVEQFPAGQQLVDYGKKLYADLSKPDVLMVLGLLEQTRYGSVRILTVIEGMMRADLSFSPTILWVESLLAPERARALIHAAVNAGLDVGIALEAILEGVLMTAPELMEGVAKEAVELGISEENAQRVIDNLIKSGICS
jgi:hypothetical protein